jgi:hypothetical protein
MTYWALNAIFLGLVAVAGIAAFAKSRRGYPGPAIAGSLGTT